MNVTTNSIVYRFMILEVEMSNLVVLYVATVVKRLCISHILGTRISLLFAQTDVVDKLHNSDIQLEYHAVSSKLSTEESF